MTNLSAVFLHYSIEPLATAFQIGDRQLSKHRDEARSEFHNHVASIHLTGDDEWIGEEAGLRISGEAYRLANFAIARRTLQAHRKAFAVMLHHAWEKHVCEQMGWMEYSPSKAYRSLEEAGWSLDRNGLERLRMMANCIKHTDASLFKADHEMFYDPDGDGTLMLLPGSVAGGKPARNRKLDGGGRYCSWDDELFIRDGLVEELIEIVRRSGSERT